MNQEHEIVALVCAAKEDRDAADYLIDKYLPFIRSETAKHIRRIPEEGYDDELSVAMYAFHEAVLSYETGRGAFLSYAARNIKNRLIDYGRKERRHENVLSLNGNGEEGTLEETLDTGKDMIHAYTERSAAKAEILKFARELAGYGLELADIAENCPKQNRTLQACHRALTYAKEHPELLELLEETGKLPMKQLSLGAQVDRKTLERHRKYVVAILLAYTNGFEIIRNHLRQIVPRKGGRKE